MTSITIKYPKETNIKEESIGNYTFLTLDYPVPGQIEILRAPNVEIVPSIIPTVHQVPTIQRSSTTVSTGPIFSSNRLITPNQVSPSVIYPTSIPALTYPSPIRAPALTYQSPVRAPTLAYSPSVRSMPTAIRSPTISTVMEFPTVVNPINDSCIGEENTLMIIVNHKTREDELIANLESYVNIKCTEVKPNHKHKLLILYFNNRGDVDIAYEIVKSKYDHIDIYK